MTKKEPTDAPLNHDKLGQWLTSCGPRGKFSTFGKVLCISAIVLGIFGSLAGVFVTPIPGNEFMSPLFLWGGLVVSLAGVGLLLSPLFTVTPQVDLYSSGIRFKDKNVVEFIPWTKISNAIITTIYETRFSSLRTARLTVDGVGELNFGTRTEGEPEVIIDAIGNSVTSVEYKEVDFGEN